MWLWQASRSGCTAGVDLQHWVGGFRDTALGGSYSPSQCRLNGHLFSGVSSDVPPQQRHSSPIHSTCQAVWRIHFLR